MFYSSFRRATPTSFPSNVSISSTMFLCCTSVRMAISVWIRLASFYASVHTPTPTSVSFVRLITFTAYSFSVCLSTHYPSRPHFSHTRYTVAKRPSPIFSRMSK